MRCTFVLELREVESVLLTIYHIITHVLWLDQLNRNFKNGGDPFSSTYTFRAASSLTSSCFPY